MAGKVALITGGSRGLGAEIAWAFAHEGADVVVASRKLGPCGGLAAELHAETGVRALGLSAHVGQWDAMQTLVDQVYEEFGHLDILVNNAGIAPTYDSLDQASEELFDKVVGVNLKGPFRLTALAAMRMAADRG
ncbi:SDR family NAD(P)-dependent oxidoreductase, partial [Frankia tisae]|uniref:SDR family NAD(P)-dependent oxidoreductase n=1 Tax=Frankia tisae TaxID=2950104 RepID=UPI0021C1F078